MLGERGGEKFICDIKVEKKLLRMWECTGGTEVWGGEREKIEGIEGRMEIKRVKRTGERRRKEEAEDC